MKHGVYTSVKDTSISTPASVSVGIPFIVGSAPVSTADADTRATLNKPYICYTFAEFESLFGYDSNYTKYTLCEAAYVYFKLFNVGPIVCVAVNEDASAEDFQTKAIAGIEYIELCKTQLGLVPDLILCPGKDNVSAVQAVMMAKAASINEKYQARAVVAVDGATYTAAITAKNSGSFNEWGIIVYGYPKLGDVRYNGTIFEAARMTATDADNNGIPYESPSNKYVPMDSLVSSTGTVLDLSESQANLLNAAGINTFINQGGQWTAWGNYTGAYPTSADVVDYFIPVARMFDYVRKVVTNTFRDKVDKPLDRRLLDSINDSVNMWLNGLVGAGYLIGARCELLGSENPTTDLMAGIIKFHIYMTPPGPAQEIDFILEYDPSYLEDLFA